MADDFDAWHFGETWEETVCPNCITTADRDALRDRHEEELAEMRLPELVQMPREIRGALQEVDQPELERWLETGDD